MLIKGLSLFLHGAIISSSEPQRIAGGRPFPGAFSHLRAYNIEILIWHPRAGVWPAFAPFSFMHSLPLFGRLAMLFRSNSASRERAVIMAFAIGLVLATPFTVLPGREIATRNPLKLQRPAAEHVKNAVFSFNNSAD